MSGSVIPGVLAALVSTWSAVGDSVGVKVLDGPAYDPPAAFLAVGWDRTDSPSVAMANARADWADGRGIEKLDVSSLLSLYSDKDEIAVLRPALFAAFEVFCAALRANHDLGGLVLSTWVSSGDLTPIAVEGGQVVELRFTTHIEASK